MTKKQLIIDYINNYIKENNLKYGDKLISEVLLAETLKVNRNTIRSAFSNLEQEGIIKRIRGSGTFVAKEDENKKYILIISTTYSTKGDIKRLYRFFCKIMVPCLRREPFVLENLSPVLSCPYTARNTGPSFRAGRRG